MTNEKREQVTERLQHLAAANGHRLTTTAVIEDALQPESPLHDLPEWRGFRADALTDYAPHHIARTVIKRYPIAYRVEVINMGHSRYRPHVEVAGQGRPVFVRHPDMPPSRAGYVSTDVLKDDPDMKRRYTVAELRRILNHALSTLGKLMIAREPGDTDDDLVAAVDRLTRAINETIAHCASTDTEAV